SNYANNAVRVLQTDTLLETLRRAKVKYQLDNDKTALGDFDTAQPKALDLMRSALDAALSPTRKAIYGSLVDAVSVHGSEFHQFTAEVDAATDGAHAMFKTGDAASQAVAALAGPLEAGSDQGLILAAARA